MAVNISFSELAKGWTSFHSFIPDAMVRLNNRFFSIKDGQLWLHNDKDNPVMNNFYGEQFVSEITTVFNDNEDIDKIYKNLVQEGNVAWYAEYETNYTKGYVKDTEFNKKESRWFAYLRKNEIIDYTGHSAQGIGVIQSIDGLNIRFSNVVSETVSIGDVLHQYVSKDETIPIGVIQNITDNIITIDAVLNAPIEGTFALSIKNSRIEGSEIRGYYLQVKLTYSGTQKAELFAISTNAVVSKI